MKQNYYFILFCLLQHFILNVNCSEEYFFVKVLPSEFKWNIEVECSKCTEILKKASSKSKVTRFTLFHNDETINELKIKITLLEEDNHAENEWKIKNINFNKLYVFDFFDGTFNNEKNIPSHSGINRSSFGYSEDDPFIKDLTEKLREENKRLKEKAANRGSSSSSYGNNTDDNNDNLKFENLSITQNKVPKPKRKGNKNSKIGNVSPSSQGSSNDNESNFGVPHVHPTFGHGYSYPDHLTSPHHHYGDAAHQLPYQLPHINYPHNHGWQHPYPYNSSGFPPNFVPIQPQPNEITHFADTNTDTYSGSDGPPVSSVTPDFNNPNESEYSNDDQNCTIC